MAVSAFTELLNKGPKQRRQRYEQLETQLWTDRAGYDSHWQELADWIRPTAVRINTTQRNRGGKRNQNIIDATARFASRTLASGMHAGLTSPARPWFTLSTPDPGLAKMKPVAEWLEQVTRRLLVLFADSNIYLAFPTLYDDLGIFGTAAMSLLPDSDDLFRAYTYPVGSFAIGNDSRGKVAIFAHRYQMTVLQVVEQFAWNAGTRTLDLSTVSRRVKDAWDKGNYQDPVEIAWMVQPNDLRDADKLGSRYMRWSSCYWERETNEPTTTFLRESGFESFPIMAPRWELRGTDIYADDCPGMTALGDVKQLQGEHRDKAKAIKKMVDPPLQGPPELRTQKTSLVAGDVTFVANMRDGGLKPIHEVKPDLSAMVADMAETQYRIQRAFYEDLFLMIARSDATLGADRPTAREIEERHEEKLLALGPVIERNGDELHDPVIDRAFDIAQRAGLLPPAPPDLQGVRLKVEYVSVMAAAQKLAGVAMLDRFLTTAVNLAGAYPETRHKIKAFEVVDAYREAFAIDPALVRTNEEAQQLAGQEAQAQAAAAQAQQAKDTAGAVNALANSPTGQGSVLDQVGAMAGATVQ